MTDFIDGLHDDLVDAARRQSRARRTALFVRQLRSSRRGLAVALVLVVGAGSAATAAVVSLRAEATKPLAGTRGAASNARGYAVSLVPSLIAGHAGWCSTLRFTTAGRVTSSGMGCGPPRAAGGTMIVSGGTYETDGGGVQYAIVTANARAVRFGDRVVATEPDPRLPYGWRYAISIAERGTPAAQALVAPPPAMTSTTTTAPSPRGGPPLPLPPIVPAIALDAAGRSLPATTRADDVARGSRTRLVTKSDPARRCVIGTASGFGQSYARIALGRPTLPARLEGRAFFTCARTTFRIPGRRGSLSAMIWLDALDPERRADALPATPGLSGRRLGQGWIAVYGGTAAQRARLLSSLRPRL